MRVRREEMVEDQFTNSGPFGNASDLADIGVQRGHSLQRGPGDAVQLEVCEVGYLVDEDVGALREGDQILVHGGVPREHDGTADGVETVGQGRNSPAMGDRDGGDPNGIVFEDYNRDPGGPLRRFRKGDVVPPTSMPGSGMWASNGMTLKW